MNNITKSGIFPENNGSFLSKILPRTGVYVGTFFSKEGKIFNKFYDTVEQLQADITKYDSQGLDVYHACASYKEKGNRKADNAGWMRSIWLDIDVGKANDAKSYATRKEAKDALLAMCRTYNLPIPMLVMSGAGLHCYWVLDTDISKEEWKPVVTAFAKALDTIGFKHDPSRTRDAASILRPVGSHWRKNGEREVKVALDAAEIPVSKFDDIVSKFSLEEKPKALSAFQVSDDLGTIEYPPSSALQIINNCAALKEVAEAKGKAPEPAWRGMIGVVKHTIEGEALCHEWSEGDERYSLDETQKKIDGWVGGPTTCNYFNELSDKCKSCKHFGKITSPIQLGISRKEVANHDIQLNMFPMSEGLIEFSDSPPPAREYVLQDLICAKKVSVLAGLGGASKTMWLMICATSVALGLEFMGKKTKQGAVLLILGEEDTEEIGRRFNAIAKHLRLNASQKNLLRQRVRAFPMSGLDTRLTKKIGGSLEGTGLTSELIKVAKALEIEAGMPVGLIGLDHAGLIHGGEFNTREDVVQTMREVSAIAEQTQSSVMVLAHAPKAAVGKSKTDSTDVAGSTAWVDLARAVFVLRGMTEEEGKHFGLSHELSQTYSSFNVVKNNYGPSGQQIWLNRITVPFYSVSVLEHVNLQIPPPKSKLANGLEGRLVEMLAEHPGRFTKTHLRDNYSGKDGQLKASKANVTTVLDDMLLEGKLIQRPPSDEERKRYGLKSQVTDVLEVAK